MLTVQGLKLASMVPCTIACSHPQKAGMPVMATAATQMLTARRPYAMPVQPQCPVKVTTISIVFTLAGHCGKNHQHCFYAIRLTDHECMLLQASSDELHRENGQISLAYEKLQEKHDAYAEAQHASNIQLAHVSNPHHADIQSRFLPGTIDRHARGTSLTRWSFDYACYLWLSMNGSVDLVQRPAAP